jgi:hypothetical protein
LPEIGYLVENVLSILGNLTKNIGPAYPPREAACAGIQVDFPVKLGTRFGATESKKNLIKNFFSRETCLPA